jgi:hypothetical protein
MNSAQVALLSLLACAAIVFLALWIRSAPHHRGRRPPTTIELAIGVVSDFFNRLGIGSFATTTSAFRILRIVADEMIPGTLNVGHAALNNLRAVPRPANSDLNKHEREPLSLAARMR